MFLLCPLEPPKPHNVGQQNWTAKSAPEDLTLWLRLTRKIILDWL